MKLKNYLFPIVLAGMLATGISAQDSVYRFEKFASDNALSHNSITAILQDYQGFLWVGTWSGLLKYDGYHIKQYKQEPNNTNGLESNKITTIFEDSQKRLWAGTRNSGLYLYDRAADRFVLYQHDPANMNSLSNNNVWAIFEDSYGFFWIGTENGLNLFKLDEGNFIHFTHNASDNRSLSFDFVYSICETPDRSLWIGTEVGLNKMVRKENGEPDYFIRYSLAPENAPLDSDAFSYHNYSYKVRPVSGEPSALWVGTKAGLKKVVFSPDDPREVAIQSAGQKATGSNSLTHNFVVDMWEWGPENLWIATFNGLNLLNRKTGQIRCFFADANHPNVFNNNIIKALFCDRSGNLWVGTEGGLNKLNLSSKPFITVHPDISENSNNNVISTIINASNGNGLWLGTRGSGLNYLPLPQTGMPSQKPRHFTLAVPYAQETAGFISDLLLDDEGWLWITTLGAGLIKIRESDVLNQGPAIRNLQQYSVGAGLDNLGDEHLMTLTQSRSGDIWIGTWDVGIVRYDKAENQFTQYKTSSDFRLDLEASPIVHLLETIENGKPVLWAGTRGDGLVKLQYDPEKDLLHLLSQYTCQADHAESISNNFINCLFIDSHNRFWIGTESGLNLFDPNTQAFRYFLEKDGLANSIIQSVLEDDQGNLWISTQKGISSLSLSSNSLDFTIKNFDAQDGLQDNFFNDDAACLTRFGEMAFGGVSGLSLFIPSQIQPDTICPQVVITDFRLFNKPIPIGKLPNGRTILEENITQTRHITLTHRENVISFEFVGLQFGEPNKIQYAHKLEGFDPDWVYTDASQRIAHYTNLPHEHFTFKVKAANGDGYWSEPVEIQLTVLPPFWMTGWAYFIYFLLFIGLLLGVRKITMMRAEFEHSLQLERVEREKLEEVNQMKVQFFTNISHELRTPLTLIISPLEQLIKERRTDKKLHQAFTRMHNNAIRLLTMINQLLDIRKSEENLMKLKVAEGNIFKFVNEVVLSFKGLARQRNIRLDFVSDKKEIPLWYDRDQMEKVLYNLISNAIKFTPEEGRIEVGLAKKEGGKHVLFWVKDTGNGIPPDQLEHIFDRFYQVEKNQEAMRKGGTGIGLALAKSIVEAHHGKIWAESPEGQGAEFYVELLTGESHFSEEEKIAGFQDSESISNYILPTLPDDEIPESTHPEISDIHPETVAQKPTLLIVEDNADIRSYLRENLQANYLIEEAADGVTGLEKALNNTPDLVIADISMPHMDGIEMCGKIKSDIQTSHIPVILLTARTSLIFKIDGLETGADDYITKPFNMRLLATRIKNLIDSRNKLKEKFAHNYDLSPSGLVMNSLDEQFLSQIKFVVEKHIDDSGFSVEQLAVGLFMSRMQLYRKIKALTGKSPNTIIRAFRLKRAAQLLETGQYNVSDVTYMVGYNDLKTFREQFKKEFGVSPSEYEKTEQ